MDDRCISCVISHDKILTKTIDATPHNLYAINSFLVSGKYNYDIISCIDIIIILRVIERNLASIRYKIDICIRWTFLNRHCKCYKIKIELLPNLIWLKNIIPSYIYDISVSAKTFIYKVSKDYPYSLKE